MKPESNPIIRKKRGEADKGAAPKMSEEVERGLNTQKEDLIAEATVHDQESNPEFNQDFDPKDYQIITHDENGNTIVKPFAPFESDYDPREVQSLINGISNELNGVPPQQRQKDAKENQQLVGDSRISEVDGEGINSGLGGNPNYTAYQRYLDGVGLSDLLDARSENIVPEVRRTKYLYHDPKNESPGKEFDPRGQGVSSSSYGIPFVYVPQLIRDLKKYQSDDSYSEGYQNSFALALLAALGLADAEGVERVPGLSGGLLPEYSAAERLDIPHMVVDPDDPDAKPRYEYIAPWGPTPEGLSEEKSAWLREKEAQVRAQGKKLFTDRFNTAMKAQGYDPGERLNDFREPLRRAMLIYALQSAAGQGDESAVKILNDLKGYIAGRRKAYWDGDEKEEQLFREDINDWYDFFLHPEDPSDVKNWLEGIPEIENELDLQGILSAALTGKYGDIELGTSLKNLVMDDLRSPEAGMPVSPKALDTTMGRYNEIKTMLSDPEIRGRMLSEAMRDRAAYLKSVADLNKSPILGAYAEKLEALAGLGDYENLSDTDRRFLESAGVPLTSKTVLAQMLGSSESADKYFRLLDLDKKDEDYEKEDVRISDYFLPREDLIKRLLEQGAIEDWQADSIEDMPKSQRGLYTRNLVNALYDDLQDSVKGYDGVGNKRVSGRIFTPWEKFQYVRHRNPKDYAKYRKRENIDGEDVEKEVWGKDFAEGPGLELDQADAGKGQWTWDSDDVKAAIEEVKNSTGALSDKTKDTLRRMGFLREANLLTDYSTDQLAEVLKKYHGNPDAKFDPKKGKGVGLLAKLDTLITAADNGLISPDEMNAEQLKELARSYAQYLAPNGAEMAYPGRPEDAKKSEIKKQISSLVSKYIGNDAVSEIGLKNYDTGIAGDLNSNAGDIYRFLLDPSRTMTRAQTYAANLDYMDMISDAEAEIGEIDEKLKAIAADSEDEESEEDERERARDLWELNNRRNKLEANIKKYKNKLQFGDNAVSFDQNSAKVDDADEVSAATKFGDEKAEDRREALEDGDQYEETSSGFEKELADLTSSFDPTDVLKNLFIAKMKEIEEGKAKKDKTYRLYPGIQNWPTFNPVIYESAMNQEFNSPDFDIVKYLNDLSGSDVLDDANYDMLYGDGTPADKQFRSIFGMFMPPSEEDFQAAMDIFKNKRVNRSRSRNSGVAKDLVARIREDEDRIPHDYSDFVHEKYLSHAWDPNGREPMPIEELIPDEGNPEYRKLLEDAAKPDALSEEQKKRYAKQLKKTKRDVKQYREQPRAEGNTPINMDYDSAFWKLKTMVEAALKDIGTPETRFQTAGFNPFHYENSPEYLKKVEEFINAWHTPEKSVEYAKKMEELINAGYTPEEAAKKLAVEYAKENGLYYQSGNTRGTRMKNNVIRTPEMWADMSTEKERRNLPTMESRQFIWQGDPDYDRAMDVWNTVVQEIRKMKSSGWTYDDVWDYLLNDEKSPLLGLPPEYMDYIRENYQSEPVVSLRKSVFSAITPIVLRAFKDGTQRAVPFAKAYTRESSDRLIRMRIA